MLRNPASLQPPHQVPAEGLDGGGAGLQAGRALPGWGEISLVHQGEGKASLLLPFCGSAWGCMGVMDGKRRSLCLIPFKRFPLGFFQLSSHVRVEEWPQDPCRGRVSVNTSCLEFDEKFV